MDNASNNKTCLQELEVLLRARELEVDFRAGDRLVSCFPHIIHICVTHVLKSFNDDEITTIIDSETWSDTFPDVEEEQDAYVEAVKADPIAMARTAIWAIRASGMRRDEFTDTIRTGNLKNWFKNTTGSVQQVPELELLRDVKTRWDSTYAMINRLRALRLVCTITDVFLLLITLQGVNYFLALPNQKELEEYTLSESQWLVLEDFERILQASVSRYSNTTSIYPR